MCSRILLVLVSLCCLAACDGSSSGSGSDSNSNQNNDRSQVGPPTDESSQTNEEISNSGGTKLNTYTRAIDYPNIFVAPPQYIPTNSGHDIGVRVTYPANEDGVPVTGPFPVILVQSGYNTGLFATVRLPGGVLLGAPDPFLVQRGYVMVSVDTLGTGISHGGWEMIGAEEQKAYGDVVDWIQQQPWADGNIGVAGASYMAITALFTAQQRPQQIKAIFASVPMGDAQRGTVGTGGLLNGVFMSQWMTATHLTATQNIPNILLNLDLMEPIMQATEQHVAQIDNFYLPVIERAINGDPELSYDSDFWRTRATLENIDQIQAPTIVLGALNDIFQRDAPLIYEALKDRVDSRLVLYDGSHITNFVQAIPGTDKAHPALYLLLQWFDKYLKGVDTATEAIPPVTQFVKNFGPGPWQGFIETTDWPHPASQPERWFFHGNGSLSQQQPNVDEAYRTMHAAEFASYHYGKQDGFLILDVIPNDGTECSPSYVQWTLGIAGLTDPKACYEDNRELERDALNYDSEPFAEDYFISGPLQADIWISSTTTDAVLSVRVDEVTQDGNVLPITNGLLLASLRAVDETRSRFVYGEMVQPYHYFSQAQERLLVPGEVTKMQVEIFPTSVLLRQGNRLRVSISPSNQAQGMLNLQQRDGVKGGVTTIYNTPEYPSSLVVLKVPLSELN